MNIKELRLQNGWSQEQLADLSNLSTRTIQRIEKENKASLESLKALANAFKLEVSDLKEKIETINLDNFEDNTKEENKSFKEFLLKDKSIMKFFAVNLMLFFINIASGTEHLWFIYPLFGWGIPLFYKRYIQFNSTKNS
jgi:transcriptional regulator with XRE-family HTH domain